MSDSWEMFGSSAERPSTPDVGERLRPLAEELHKLVLEREEADQRIGQLENEISRLFPEEAGQHAHGAGAFEVVVSRSERWSWDKTMLAKHFGEGDLPDFVNRSLTVDKRKFLKLPIEEQNALKYALTRKLDNPKVKVIRNVQDV